MKRLYCYVEGQTEQGWCHDVLRRHLAPFNVYLEGAVLAASGRRHGEIARGGGRNYLPMKNDLVRLLRQHRGPDVRFTTMFDLYALYSDFPGMQEAEKLKHLPAQRVRGLEQAFATDVGDTRFIPHVQLHEFETILLCDPGAFAVYYENCEKQIQALRDLVPEGTSPESIDGGQHSAPSKRIAVQFPDYPDAKPDAPVAIATTIDVAVIRTRCPHFDAWIRTLEQLDPE
jgi:hypothetical protein